MFEELCRFPPKSNVRTADLKTRCERIERRFAARSLESRLPSPTCELANPLSDSSRSEWKSRRGSEREGRGKREGGDIAFDCRGRERGREDGRIYLSELKLKLRGKAACAAAYFTFCHAIRVPSGRTNVNERTPFQMWSRVSWRVHARTAERPKADGRTDGGESGGLCGLS